MPSYQTALESAYCNAFEKRSRRGPHSVPNRHRTYVAGDSEVCNACRNFAPVAFRTRASCLSRAFYPSERDSARILFLINNFSMELVHFRMHSVTPTAVVAAAPSAVSCHGENPFQNRRQMEGHPPATREPALAIRCRTCTDDKMNLI